MCSILLVEDNRADAHLVCEALVWNQVTDEILIAEDGEQALNAVDAADRGECTMPRLVLLDLNLPKVDGFTVLRSIRERKPWIEVPVMVLSSSARATDIRQCYELGATVYRQKPLDLDGLMSLGKELSLLLGGASMQ